MKLTKQERLKCYKLALSYFIWPKQTWKAKIPCNTYICHALEESLFDTRKNYLQWDGELMQDIFPEMRKFKPKDAGTYQWFPDDDIGKKRRIKILVKIIKYLS